MQIQQINKLSLDSSDTAIAQQVVVGDTGAFEILVKRYSTPLFNYIYHFMHDQEDTSDVLQEVFVRFYLLLPSLDHEKPFKSWLFQVAHNYCIDRLRQKRRYTLRFSQLEIENGDGESSLLDEIPDTSASVEDLIEEQDVQDLLQRAISSLPIKFRNVVILRYTSNLRFSEIGKILDMPEQTTKTYFHRAKALLRKRLEQTVLHTI